MKQLQYKLSSLAEVRELIDKSQPVALDLETQVSEGLYSTIELVQLYQKHWKAALLVPKPEVFELSATLKDLHIVAHNASYEVSTIQKQLGKAFSKPTYKWLPTKWDDTLLLAKFEFFNKEDYSLDDCYEYLFGYDLYAHYKLDKKELQKSDWSKLNEDKMTYAALDVFYLLDLYDACSNWLNDQSYLLTKSATELAFSFQTNGVPLSKQLVNDMLESNTAKVKEINCPVNVNSWKQVRPYIGEDESDGLSLATFALEGNERAAQVNEARKLLKQNSFLNGYLKHEVDSRIYGHFMFTTKSGRGNCSEQNLQQLPRNTKSVFQASDGKLLVMSDFAQLELRYACAVSGEPLMAKLFKEGVDLHTETANMMGVPRQQAKTCNFNLLYGGSAKMLRSIFIKEAGILLSLGEVQSLKKKWHNLWVVLTQWQNKLMSDHRKGVPQTTLLGRPLKAKLYTDALNLPIQGGSADIAKLAMHKMFKRLEELPELSDRVKFINFVHDSFMWEVDNNPKVYETIASITAESMQEAWSELVQFTEVPDLPMPVDVIVGKNWGNLEYEIETPVYTLNI